MDTPIIWTYWENKNGQSDPVLVQKHKAIFQQYENVVIVNDQTIHDYVKDLVDCSRIEYIAQKVDYYRAKLLYEYGGVWIDMDAIMLEDFDDLWTALINSNYEASCEYEDSVCNIQVLLFKPKSVIAEKWYKYCEETIQSKTHLDWATLGGVGLGKIIHDNEYCDRLIILPSSVIWTFGCDNRQYEAYYQTDPHFIVDHLQNVRERKPKCIMLYGTFMYQQSVPEHSLLEQMWKIAERQN